MAFGNSWAVESVERKENRLRISWNYAEIHSVCLTDRYDQLQRTQAHCRRSISADRRTYYANHCWCLTRRRHCSNCLRRWARDSWSPVWECSPGSQMRYSGNQRSRFPESPAQKSRPDLVLWGLRGIAWEEPRINTTRRSLPEDVFNKRAPASKMIMPLICPHILILSKSDIRKT